MSGIVVVGATGVLAPAVHELGHRGATVVAVARRADQLCALRAECEAYGGHVEPLATDARDAGFCSALDAVVGEPDWQLTGAIVYEPATSPVVLDTLADMVRGPLVEVVTSKVAAPANGDDHWSPAELPPARSSRLVLGWHVADGGSRWHEAEEISADAVAMLSDPRDQVLGTVRPWSSRP